MTGGELMDAIADAAHVAGWRVAHWRAARTQHGWRTPCQYDAKGWPDLILVGPRLVVAEIKGDGDRLSEEQATWLLQLGIAGVEVHVWGSEEWTDGSVDAVLGLPTTGRAA